MEKQIEKQYPDGVIQIGWRDNVTDTYIHTSGEDDVWTSWCHTNFGQTLILGKGNSSLEAAENCLKNLKEHWSNQRNGI